MATQSLDPKTILNNFREWPIEDQVALVHPLIRELAIHEQTTRHRLSVYDLAGIARRGSDIPSDEQIEAWLDERRMKEA
jgi:hypothetical protein